MAEESGQVVASQAVVLIGADYSQVDAALDRAQELENKIRGLNLAATVKLQAPSATELRAQLEANMAEAMRTPLSLPVRPVLAADFARDIQAQLVSRTFDINVRPVVSGNVASGPVPAAQAGGNPGGVVNVINRTGGVAPMMPPASVLPPNPAPLPESRFMGAAERRAQLMGQAGGVERIGAAVAEQVAATGMSPMRAARSLFDNEDDARAARDDYNKMLMDHRAQNAAGRPIAASVTAADFDRARRDAENARALAEMRRGIANSTLRTQVGSYNPTLAALSGDAGIRPLSSQEQDIIYGYSSRHAALPSDLRPDYLGANQSELALLRRQMETRARVESNIGNLASAPERSGLVGSEAKEAAYEDLNRAYLRRLGVYGNPVAEDLRSEVEASMSGSSSEVPWSAGQRAQTLRNQMLLGPRQSWERFVAGPSVSELQEAEKREMKLQQNARRNYFAGETLTHQFTYPALIGAGALIANSVGFDREFGKIGALTDTDPRSIPGIKQNLFDLSMGRVGGRPVFSSPEDLASGYYEAASVGFPGIGGLRINRASAEGSSVGMGSVRQVEDVVTAVMNAYGAKPADARKIVNKILSGVIIGEGDASDYVNALPDVISTAADMNVGIDQVMASLATSSKVGIKPGIAAHSLNQLLMHLQAPTPQGVKMMARMDWTPQSMLEDVQNKGLLWVSQEIIKRSGGNNQIIDGLVGNVRGFKSIMSTAGVQSQAYEDTLHRMQTAHDQVDKSLERMGDTVDAQWKRIVNTVRGSGLELVNQHMPEIVQSMKSVADNIPNVTGKAGDIWASTGSVGPAAALGVGGALVAAGPLFRAMAVIDDARSLLEKSPRLRGGLTSTAHIWGPAAGLFAARELGFSLPDKPIIGGLTPLDIATYGAAGFQGYGIMAKLANRGVVAGNNLLSGATTGANRLGSTYAAYREAMQAEAAFAEVGGRTAPGALSVAAGFLPWMVRGGAPTAEAASAEAVAAGGAGVLGGAALPGAAVVAAIGGASYFQEYQRELADREGQRKQIEGGRQLIGKMFEKTDNLLSYSPEAENRLGNIATEFAGAGADVDRLNSVLKEVQDFKLDIDHNKVKLDPGLGRLLQQDLDKISGEIKLHVGVVLEKPENAWSAFKKDWMGSIGDAYDYVASLGGVVPDHVNQLKFGDSNPDNSWRDTHPGGHVPMPLDANGQTPRQAAEAAARANQTPPEDWLGHGNRPTSNQDILGHRNRPLDAGNSPTVNRIQGAAANPALLALQSALGIHLAPGTDLGKWVNETATWNQIKKLNSIIGSQPEHGPLQTAIGDGLARDIVQRNQKIANYRAPSHMGSGGVDGFTPDQISTMQAAQKGLEGEADGVRKLAGAYGSFQSATDGLIGRLRDQFEHTERLRTINEMYKHGLDGVSESYKQQEIAIAGLLDRTKELAGFKDSLKGYVAGVQESVSSVGGNLNAGMPHIARLAGILDYSGRMTGLTNAALTLGGNVATGAWDTQQALNQQANNIAAQASAAGSDYKEAHKYQAKGVLAGPSPFTGGVPDYLKTFYDNVGKVTSNVMGASYQCGESISEAMRRAGRHVTATSVAATNNAQPDAQGHYPVGTILHLGAAGRGTTRHYGIAGLVRPDGQQDFVESTANVSHMNAAGYHIRASRTVSDIRGRIIGAGLPADVNQELVAQQPMATVSGTGKVFFSKVEVAPARALKKAPVPVDAFEGTDDSLASRNLNLQGFLGARIRPLPWNRNQFSLQQFLEQSSLQEKVAAAARIARLGVETQQGYKFSDDELSTLEGMSSMSADQVKKILFNKKNSDLLQKAIDEMHNFAIKSDLEVSHGSAVIDYTMEQLKNGVANRAAWHPNDELGNYGAELSDEDGGLKYLGSYGQLMKDSMVADRARIMHAQDVTARDAAFGQVYSQTAGLAAGGAYIGQNPRMWRQDDYTARVQLAQRQMELEGVYRLRYPSNPALQAANVQADLQVDSARAYGQLDSGRSMRTLGVLNGALDRTEDLDKWRSYILKGMTPTAAEDQIALERGRVNYYRDGLSPDLAFLDQQERAAERQKANMSRNIGESKRLAWDMASVGDTTGIVAGTMRARDPEQNEGLSPYDVDSLVNGRRSLYWENQYQQQQRQSFMSGYGRYGIRNQFEQAQADASYFDQNRGERFNVVTGNGMSPSDANNILKDERQGINDRLNFARSSVLNDESVAANRRGLAQRDQYEEQLKAVGSVTDKQREQLYILQQKNDLAQRGIDLDKLSEGASADQLKTIQAITDEIDKQAKEKVENENKQVMLGFRRRAFDSMQSVTLQATQNLFSPDQAAKESKQLSLRDESYRWSQLSMDLLDRGYTTDSKEYKAAQKRHHDLEKEMNQGGGIKGWLSDVVGGWGNSARTEAANVANYGLWDVMGGGIAGLLGLNSFASKAADGNNLKLGDNPFKPSVKDLIGNITGFNGGSISLGSLLGGALGSSGGQLQVSSLTINAGSVNVNGGSSSPIAGLMLKGGGASSDQWLGALGYGVQLASRR